MALAKASLPQLNQSNRRTRLRPRDLVTVAYVSTGSPRPISGAIGVKNAAFSVVGLGRARIQRYLDTAQIAVAT